MPVFRVSQRKDKKYDVLYNGHWISFGHPAYEHFLDSTGVGAWSELNHFDEQRRANYLRRASGIVDASGKKTINNPNSPNYWATRYLWSYKK